MAGWDADPARAKNAATTHGIEIPDSAAALLEGASAALAALEEGEAASLPLLQHAGARLSELTGFDAALGEAGALFESALIQLEESALALRRYQDRLELDPARLNELDDRIDAVTQMARKHRVVPEELPELLQRLQARLAELALRADPAALAERARLVDLRRKELWVEVDASPWAQELQFLKPKILAALDRALGPGKVKDLRVRVGGGAA